MKRKVLAILLVCLSIVNITACGSTTKITPSADITVQNTEDILDFDDLDSLNEEKETTKTTEWSEEKFGEMRDYLTSCFYANFSQTNTSGIYDEKNENVYAALNQYDVWVDLNHKDYKITNNVVEQAGMRTATYVRKDGVYYYFDPNLHEYTETSDTTVLDTLAVDSFATGWDLVEFLSSKMIPSAGVKGTVNKDGYEHYVITSDTVDESFITDGWSDYTSLDKQIIEFVYNPEEKIPVNISVKIIYTKDNTSCYTKTELVFTTIAFNGGVLVN